MFVQALIARWRDGFTLAAASAGLALAVLPAKADQWSPYAPIDDVTTQNLTVYAPPPYVRQPTTGARVRLDSVSLVVRLDDLDLSTPLGAWVAKMRINAAAREACARVEDLYPNNGEVEGGCFGRAVREAVAQAERIARYPILAWGNR